MKINNIIFTKRFNVSLLKLSAGIENKLHSKLDLFLENPFHPSLRLHTLKGKLAGYRSISLDKKIRVIFIAKPNGDIFLIAIGGHSIYEKRSSK